MGVFVGQSGRAGADEPVLVSQKGGPIGSETALWFQAQIELASSLIVGEAALDVLGNHPDILKLALNRVAGKNRAGAAQVVADINHLRRFTYGEGGC